MKAIEGRYRRFKYKVITQDTGVLCGYVLIPREHLLFERTYQDGFEPPFDVHGGITYSGTLEQEGAWWLGFDCCHPGDRIDINGAADPLRTFALLFNSIYPGGEIRTVDFVKEECKNFIDQIIEHHGEIVIRKRTMPNTEHRQIEL